MSPRDWIIILLLCFIALMVFTLAFPDWHKTKMEIATEKAEEEISRQRRILP